MRIRRTVYSLTALGGAAMALCLMLLTGMSAAPQVDRGVAQARWEAAGVGSYRASVRIEYRGDICFQQIEVRFGSAHAIRNTCDVAWLDLMSVPELFDLARQIESIPPARCYPSSRWCICQRVFDARMVEYDRDLGYPTLVLSRSSMRPNWTGLDFWDRMLETRAMPQCGPTPRRLTIEVLALTPVP
jgi:hypothetical protein